MWRRRCVGARLTPSASATSSPCAHVSISRAVTIEVGDMLVPYQGIFCPAGTAVSAPASADRPERQRASSAPGGARKDSAPSSTRRDGSGAAITEAKNADSSVAAR